MESAVILDSVSKRFGIVKAVQGLDLEVAVGTVYGLLGPNGSGKSTTMKIIMGLLTFNSEEIEVYGMSPQREPLEVKRAFGDVPDLDHSRRDQLLLLSECEHLGREIVPRGSKLST